MTDRGLSLALTTLGLATLGCERTAELQCYAADPHSPVVWSEARRTGAIHACSSELVETDECCWAGEYFTDPEICDPDGTGQIP
jgi:hypothetical protein